LFSFNMDSWENEGNGASEREERAAEASSDLLSVRARRAATLQGIRVECI
jgi:hypothetical protein